MKDNRTEIKAAFDAYMEESTKFWDGGNASAGTRARNALMDIKNLAHAERNAIQEKKNETKGK